MKLLSLNGSWNVICYALDGTVDFQYEGKVPGCVHTDLSGTKLPDDVFFRDNADRCQWIETRDFEYSKTFTLDSVPANAELVFDGLDTYADIYLNGTLLASTDNMFIRHTFPVSDTLKIGENNIRVHFYSPIKKVEGLPLREGAFTRERMYTRRIQCTYGWDWVARFVTCGIWRDVYIDSREGFNLKDAYIYTDTVTDEYATVVVEAEFEGYENGGFADVIVTDPEDKEVYSNRFFRKENFLKEYVYIPNPKLWYPAGYGEQPLYTITVCGRAFRFGIRTAKILELPDPKDSPYYQKCLEIKDSVSGREYDKNKNFSGFQLLINNVPIMCKGANWVPSEPFPSAETDEKITALLLLAKEANLNILRVWGGGIFEKQHFYNECDRLGILVTQDFLMACGSYPEDDPSFIEQIKKETEFAARELRNHPSLVWWSGDNENAVIGHDASESYSGRTAIHEGIYPVLNRLDPHRRFLLSSPYGGNVYASKTKGTTHNTQYLGCSIFPYIMNEDMQDYKEHFAQYLARFIAEEPTTGAVCLPSLRRFMTDEDIYEGDGMWNYHVKSNPALPFTLFDTLASFTRKVLGEFKDGKDRFFKLKYAQYEWIRISLENIRRNKGFINGIIYWMWNDCWPAAGGWAFVDYYLLPKASFYSFKRCASGVVCSIDKKSDYEFYVCNDTLDTVPLALSVSYLLKGKYTHVKTVPIVAKSSCSERYFSLPISDIPECATVICNISGTNVSDRAFYKNGSLPIVPCTPPRILAQTADSITLTADSYIHAVELEGEYVFGDNYFSLLPGETKTVTKRATDTAVSEELTVSAYTLSE